MTAREPEEPDTPRIGRLGVWSLALDHQPAEEAAQAVREFEAAGYGCVWIPEAYGKEAMSHAALVLSGTRTISVATGIANIWARDASAMVNGARTLLDAYPGRFLLGMGVSFPAIVEDLRGHRFDKPLARLDRYLTAMDEAVYTGPGGATPVPRVLAALGPRMLELAARRGAGAHTYLVTPQHTERARERLGAGPLLAVEQTAVVDVDGPAGDQVAREFVATYLALPHHRRNLLRLGFEERDLEAPGSDRLVNALVARTAEGLVDRVRAHREAGADHVCVQVLRPDRADPAVDALRELAPALAGAATEARTVVDVANEEIAR